jgi:hypothetical protein
MGIGMSSDTLIPIVIMDIRIGFSNEWIKKDEKGRRSGIRDSHGVIY